MAQASGSARLERYPDTDDTLTDEDAAMTLTRTADEVARLGDEIYERDIRAQVEAEHDGEVVAIDVESGCWGLGKTATEARAQLDRQRAGVTDVRGVRIGHRALHHFGGGPIRSDP